MGNLTSSRTWIPDPVIQVRRANNSATQKLQKSLKSLTLLMLLAAFVARDSTHRGCCSQHSMFPWDTHGTILKRYANNDARETDDFIGCECDFPV